MPNGWRSRGSKAQSVGGHLRTLAQSRIGFRGEWLERRYLLVMSNADAPDIRRGTYDRVVVI